MATTTATVNGYLQMPNGFYLLKPDGGKIIINQTSITCELITLKTRDDSLTLETRGSAKTLKSRDDSLTVDTRDDSLTVKPRDDSFTLQPDRD